MKGQSISLFSKHLLSMYCAPETMQGTGNTKWGRHRPCCLEGETKKTRSCKINRGSSIAWRTSRSTPQPERRGLMEAALELRHLGWRRTSQVARHTGQMAQTQVRKSTACPQSAGCEGQGKAEREKRTSMWSFGQSHSRIRSTYVTWSDLCFRWRHGHY